MKRLIASRKLKKTCFKCDKSFKKGDVYYIDRRIVYDEDDVCAYEDLICPKCKYKAEQHNMRIAQFKLHCKHPREFTEMVYEYIPGECVKAPAYEYCRLCEQITD